MKLEGNDRVEAQTGLEERSWLITGVAGFIGSNILAQRFAWVPKLFLRTTRCADLEQWLWQKRVVFTTIYAVGRSSYMKLFHHFDRYLPRVSSSGGTDYGNVFSHILSST